ncbi:MAG: hypothetical protein HY719_13930 [Planctomycetes bacterium]|nr:hypothetical protein [Planctomycetota bacterium]
MGNNARSGGNGDARKPAGPGHGGKPAPGQGRKGPAVRRRPSGAARRGPSALGRALRVCFTLLLIAGLGAGGWFGWQYVATMLKPADADRSATLDRNRQLGREIGPGGTGTLEVRPVTVVEKPPAPAPAPVIGAIVARPSPPPVAPPSEPAVNEQSIQQAAALVAGGKAYYRDRKYAEALGRFREALALPGLPKDQVAEIARLADRADVMARLLAVKRESIDPGLWVAVTRTSGGGATGRLPAAGDHEKKTFEVLVTKGVRAFFRLEDVGNIRFLTTEEVKVLLAGRVVAKEDLCQRAGVTDLSRLYALARFAVENHQVDRAVGMLETAFDRDPQAALTIRVQDDPDYNMFTYARGVGDTAKVKQLADLLRGRYPGAAFLDDVEQETKVFEVKKPTKEAVAEIARKVEAEVKVVKAAEKEEQAEIRKAGQKVEEEKKSPEQLKAEKSTDAAEVLATARQFAAEGREHERNSLPGKPNEKAELRNAIKTYEKARDLFQRAISLGVKDEDAVEEELATVMSGMFWCSKRTPIF